MNEKLLDEITRAVNQFNTTLQCDDSGEDFITFVTRENGDVGEEDYGEEDWEDACRTSKHLLNKFRGKIKTDIYTVDEWVYLTVNIK